MNLANMSLCVSLLRLAVGFCSVYSVLAVLLPYNPALQSGLLERNDLIENYFHLGLTATEILMFLLMVHGINLSRRQLKRILQSRRGLRRRGDASCVRVRKDHYDSESLPVDRRAGPAV